MDEKELAYIAGFFDGEGWIGINRRSSGPKYKYFSLMVGAGQCDPRPLKFIQDRFGGGVSVGRSGKHLFYTWVIYSKVAEGFLRAIQPYLIHKKDQCEVALSYRSFVNSRCKANHLAIDAEYAALLKRVRSESREPS